MISVGKLLEIGLEMDSPTVRQVTGKEEVISLEMCLVFRKEVIGHTDVPSWHKVWYQIIQVNTAIISIHMEQTIFKAILVTIQTSRPRINHPR